MFFKNHALAVCLYREIEFFSQKKGLAPEFGAIFHRLSSSPAIISIRLVYGFEFSR